MRKTVIWPDGRIEETEVESINLFTLANEVSSEKVYTLRHERTFLGEPALWFVRNSKLGTDDNLVATTWIDAEAGGMPSVYKFQGKVIVLSGMKEGPAWDQHRGQVYNDN